MTKPSYDLSATLAKHMDPHLVIPMVSFLQSKGLITEQESLRQQDILLRRTKMVDYHGELLEAMGGDPKDIPARRAAVEAEFRALEKDARPMMEFLGHRELVAMLRKDKAFNLQYLEEEFKIGSSQIEALYEFAKLLYDVGCYDKSAQLLESYMSLTQNYARTLAAAWGRFGAAIVTAGMDNQWQHAHSALLALKEVLDTNKSGLSPFNLVQQRTWLMHWGLFVFFNHPSGRSLLVDLFMQEPYLNAVQTNAPHLLRYFAVAVLANRDRRSALKELIRTLKQEVYQYQDPVTEFVMYLYSQYNFDKAHEMLSLCQEVMETDYFLCHGRDAFVQNARQVIFEMYCRLHSAVDLQSLATKLMMDRDDAEKWIVDLVSTANLNARIDSAAGVVVMGLQHRSVLDQMMDTARFLAIRTLTIADAVIATAEANAA